MLTFAKDHMATLLAALEVDGIKIEPGHIYRDMAGKNRQKPNQYAFIFAGVGKYQEEKQILAKDWIEGVLSVQKAKWTRTIPLLVTIGGTAEDWVDKALDALLVAMPKRIQDETTGDWYEITPVSDEFVDSEAVLGIKAHAAVVVVEYSRTITAWEGKPHFDKVQIDIDEMDVQDLAE